MTHTGHILNGVVVLDGNPILPEGATVTVTLPEHVPSVVPKHRIQVPLVRTSQPGTLHLTNAQIGEILDEEDAAH